MKIYPCLAAGYFVLFVMYAQIIFLYYFSDTTGSLLTAVVFCLGTLLGSIWATTLPIIWYGLGLVIGSLLGWSVAFFRIRYIERHLEGHIFCRERIMKAGEGEKPSNLVFDRYAAKESAERG